MSKPSAHAVIKLRLAECQAIVERVEKMLKTHWKYNVKCIRVPRMKIKAHYRAAHWRVTLVRR